jgi:hypothetical protein
MVGAIGLLVGLLPTTILLISSGGLTLLMFFRRVRQLKVKDGLLASSPAYILLRFKLYIFYRITKIFMELQSFTVCLSNEEVGFKLSTI